MIASALIDDLLTRIRDTNATGTSRAYVLATLSDMQRLINARRASVVDGVDYTVPERTNLIVTSTAAPAAIRILGIRQDQRDLAPVRWRGLPQIDRHWISSIGPRFEAYGLIGKELIALWPGLATATEIRIVYVKLTAALTSEAATLDLPDEHGPELLDLTEAILLVRLRLFTSAAAALKRVSERGPRGLPRIPVDTLQPPERMERRA